MQFSLSQRIFILETYFKTSSYKDVREKFVEKFDDKEPPTNRSIRLLVKKFRETGSAGNKGHNKPRSVLSDGLLSGIRNELTAKPNLSLRKIAANKNISLGSSHTAVRKILKLYPYKIQVLQQLSETDFTKRISYCRWFVNFLDNDPTRLDNVYFSDEAWFQLDGYVNNQNFRMWCSENPHCYKEAPLHSQKIGVWCAVSRKKIIGPIFFDGRLNSEAYLNIIMEFIGQLELDDSRCWFQQDGATCHTSATTTEELHKFFHDRLISKNIWPPRFPDLTSLDFFLWGYLKDKVYLSNPQTIHDLKINIRREVACIPEEVLKKVSLNMIKRVNACLQENGRHFQHLL